MSLIDRKYIACAALSALGAAVLSSSACAATTAEQVRARCAKEGRPCVGLVLSGGGARGFAHVGVVKILERLGVKIDVVTGTSMGSMIGGAFAAGYSYEDLREVVVSVDWDKMLASRPERRFLPWKNKEDDFKGLPETALELDSKGRIRLPEGLVPSQELDLFFAERTGFASSVDDLSDLPIPFAAVATDLVTGERVVMQKSCTLGAAMRASMSVPGAFAPVQQGDRILVDGGLTDNLPVELAREMGADVVIAVNVGTPLSGREELGSVVGVMAQMVNILTEQNVKRSLAGLRQGDVLISPDLDGLTSADLKYGEKIIELGRKAAEDKIDELRKFAVNRGEYASWESERRRLLNSGRGSYGHVIADVQVDGALSVPAERVIASAGIDRNDAVTDSEVQDAARRIWADGYFSSVTYRFEPGPNGTEVLVFEPREKRPGYSTVRIGGMLETDFSSKSNYSVYFSHVRHLINSWGGEWRNEVELGETQSFSSEFYQPIGAGSLWFVQPSIELKREPFDEYDGDVAVSRWRNESAGGKVMLGREIDRLGYAGVSAGFNSRRVKRELGLVLTDFSEDSQTAGYVSGEFLLDTLDDASFPTKGFRLGGSIAMAHQKSNETESRVSYMLSGAFPVSWGMWTAVGDFMIGQAEQDGAFRLGGAYRMVGAPYGRWSGSKIQYARASLARNINEKIQTIKQPIWVGASFEVGRAWNEKIYTREPDEDWKKAYSLFVGIDSIVGPLYLIGGRTIGEGSGVYFFWGHRI